MSAGNPDMAAVERLIDELTARGFWFRHTTSGEEGPVLGNRVSDQWVDTVYLDGVNSGCLAWRQRRRSLLVPGTEATGLVERRVGGGALSVLGEVLTWDPES